MKTNYSIIALFAGLSVLLFNSCSNELNVVDSYREIPVVYGLLNPASTTNYVRIERAFLGAGNALLMAQQPDSSYYDTTALAVNMISYNGNVAVDTLTLTPTTVIPKDEGLFTDADHILYQLSNTTINPNYQYQLVVLNKWTGKIISSKLKVIDRVSLPYYAPGLSKMSFFGNGDYVPYSLLFRSSANGKIYGLILRMHYTETNKISQVTTAKYVDFYTPQITTTNTKGGTEEHFTIDGKDFFRFLAGKIPVDPNVKRNAASITCDWLIAVGSQDFYNYVEINKPANTVNYIPNFTTISFEGTLRAQGKAHDTNFSQYILVSSLNDFLAGGSVADPVSLVGSTIMCSGVPENTIVTEVTANGTNSDGTPQYKVGLSKTKTGVATGAVNFAMGEDINAKGIFTCRLDTVIHNVIFKTETLDSLIRGQYTKQIFQ